MTTSTREGDASARARGERRADALARSAPRVGATREGKQWAICRASAALARDDDDDADGEGRRQRREEAGVVVSNRNVERHEGVGAGAEGGVRDVDARGVSSGRTRRTTTTTETTDEIVRISHRTRGRRRWLE